MILRKAIKNIWKRLSPATRANLVRATQDQFTVSTAVIIVAEDKKILLLNHVLRPYSGWGFPGGFVEEGEQVAAAVRRESKEEADIELADLRLLEVNTFGGHVEILWAARGVGEPKVSSAEITELGWFELDEIKDKVAPKQFAQVEAALRSN